jgi:outer membrane protein assembly factor BamB
MGFIRKTSPNGCPVCGAPLPSGTVENCQYCGAAVNPSLTAAKAAARTVDTVGKKAWRRAIIYTVVILGFSGAMAVMNQMTVSKNVEKAEALGRSIAEKAKQGATPAKAPQRERLSVSDILAHVPKADGGGGVLVSTNSDSLILLDAGTGKPRWKNTTLGGSVKPRQVLLSKERAFIALENRVVALDLRTGDMAWQGSLMADYTSYADGMRLFGDRLAVLSQDGTTQVFDTGTGQTVWSRKVAPPPSRLLGGGKYLVEFGRNGKKRARDAELAVFDLSTGEAVRRFEPRCSTHSIIPPDEPSASSPVLFSEDGEDLYLFYGTFRTCAERWNLRSGKRAWQLNSKQGVGAPRRGSEGPHFLMGADRIVYLGNKAVYSLDRKRGELRTVLADPEQHLVPTYLQGNLLLVAANATWDGSDCKNAKSCALLAVDLDQAKVRWRHALPKLGSNWRHVGYERFVGVLAPDAFTLLQVAGEGYVEFDRLNRETGVGMAHKRIPVEAMFKHAPSPHLYQVGDTFWVSGSGPDKVLDASTGDERYRLD